MKTPHAHKCTLCGTVYVLSYDDADYKAWRNEGLIQDHFPYLDAGERELLISGTCNICFHNMFPGEDDE